MISRISSTRSSNSKYYMYKSMFLISNGFPESQVWISRNSSTRSSKYTIHTYKNMFLISNGFPEIQVQGPWIVLYTPIKICSSSQMISRNSNTDPWIIYTLIRICSSSQMISRNSKHLKNMSKIQIEGPWIYSVLYTHLYIYKIYFSHLKWCCRNSNTRSLNSILYTFIKNVSHLKLCS